MPQISEKIEQIELLRQRLHKLISERNCLLDKEILEVSTLLDSMLNEYSELLKYKQKDSIY
jgi:hypothetical protein